MRGDNYFFSPHFTSFLTKIHRHTSTRVVMAIKDAGGGGGAVGGGQNRSRFIAEDWVESLNRRASYMIPDCCSARILDTRFSYKCSDFTLAKFLFQARLSDSVGVATKLRDGCNIFSMTLAQSCKLYIKHFGSFPFVPPQLSGSILFALPDARAIYLHNDLLFNGTCFVTGGA